MTDTEIFIRIEIILKNNKVPKFRREFIIGKISEFLEKRKNQKTIKKIK
jgi:hypothetical protein